MRKWHTLISGQRRQYKLLALSVYKVIRSSKLDFLPLRSIVSQVSCFEGSNGQEESLPAAV